MGGRTWYRLELEPLGPVVFRRPGVFEPGETGPLIASSTLIYPEPSTIAGALARIGYEIKGPCRRAGRFGDLRECLERVFGKEYELVSGFAEVGGKLYVNAENSLLPIDNLGEYTDYLCNASGALEKVRRGSLRPLTSTYTGIGLQRQSKSVRERLIYTMEQVYPFAQPMESRLAGSGYEAIKYIIYVREGQGGIDITGEIEARKALKLGGEMRMAKAQVQAVSPGGLPWNTIPQQTQGKEKSALYLVTPALIEAQALKNESILTSIIESSPETSHKLAKLLTKKPNERLVTPERIEAIYPGWSSRDQYYRQPVLRIPPGSVICQEQPQEKKLTWLGTGKEAGYGASIKITTSTQQ